MKRLRFSGKLSLGALEVSKINLGRGIAHAPVLWYKGKMDCEAYSSRHGGQDRLERSPASLAVSSGLTRCYKRRRQWTALLMLTAGFSFSCAPRTWDPGDDPEDPLNQRKSRVIEGQLVETFIDETLAPAMTQTAESLLVVRQLIYTVDKSTGSIENFGSVPYANSAFIVEDDLCIKVYGPTDLPEVRCAPTAGGDFRTVYRGEEQVSFVSEDGHYHVRRDTIYSFSDIYGTPVITSQSIVGLSHSEGVVYWGIAYQQEEPSRIAIHSYEVGSVGPANIIVSNGGSPHFYNQQIYFYDPISGNVGRADRDGTNLQVLFSVDASTRIWSYKPVICQDYLYLADDHRVLYRYDLALGPGAQASRLTDGLSPTFSPPLCDDDHVYFAIPNEGIYRYPHPPR